MLVSSPDLHARIQMVEDVVVFQLAVAVVVEIHADLLATVYPVAPENGLTASGDPHTSQCVAVHLILLYQALAFLMLNTNASTMCLI